MSVQGTGRPGSGDGARLGLLRSILENANDAVLVTEGSPIDEPGPRIVYVNAAFSRMTGYSFEEIVGETPRVLQGARTNRARLDEIRAALERNESVRVELLNYRKDGTSFWVELDVVPVFGEGVGWPQHWVSVQRETTGRVRAEEARLEAERRLRAVLARYGSDMITILEPDGTPRYESPAVERTLGYRHREEAAGDVFRFVHPDDVPEISRSVAEALTTPGEHPPVEFRMRHADGSWRWFESASNNLSHDPNVGGIVVVTRNVTERKEAEEDLKESEQLLRAVALGAPVITFALDPKGAFTFENGCALRDLGLEPGQNVGRSVFEVYAGFPEILENVRRSLSGEQVVATVELGGRSYHTTYSPQRGEEGRVVGVIGVATDITERRRLEKELEHRAFHDPLTGLPNRTLFMDRLSQALKRAERGRGEVAVLFLDLDGFKAVNDRYGHEAGDGVLATAARRIEGCLRPHDTVARLGGDEFAVLIEGGGPESAGVVAERIVEALRTPIAVGEDGREVSVTASVGAARAAAGKGPVGLLREADRAMYEAKRRGREGATG